uniref:Uncharacterized protein n=1 Tax=Rangifer tarandus platyrhynchus TaxID=3082113 RepID=A0ACB0E8I8_RANTA|nr:unnamed protein product [Rangifer tarandus platyrhynchus]
MDSQSRAGEGLMAARLGSAIEGETENGTRCIDVQRSDSDSAKQIIGVFCPELAFGEEWQGLRLASSVFRVLGSLVSRASQSLMIAPRRWGCVQITHGVSGKNGTPQQRFGTRLLMEALVRSSRSEIRTEIEDTEVGRASVPPVGQSPPSLTASQRLCMAPAFKTEPGAQDFGEGLAVFSGAHAVTSAPSLSLKLHGAQPWGDALICRGKTKPTSRQMSVQCQRQVWEEALAYSSLILIGFVTARSRSTSVRRRVRVLLPLFTSPDARPQGASPCVSSPSLRVASSEARGWAPSADSPPREDGPAPRAAGGRAERGADTARGSGRRGSHGRPRPGCRGPRAGPMSTDAPSGLTRARNQQSIRPPAVLSACARGAAPGPPARARRQAAVPAPLAPPRTPSVTELRRPAPRTGCRWPPVTPVTATPAPLAVVLGGSLPSVLPGGGPWAPPALQPVIPGGCGVALPSVAWEAEPRRALVLVCCWRRLLSPVIRGSPFYLVQPDVPACQRSSRTGPHALTRFTCIAPLCLERRVCAYEMNSKACPLCHPQQGRPPPRPADASHRVSFQAAACRRGGSLSSALRGPESTGRVARSGPGDVGRGGERPKILLGIL